ncbi:hypothetical protein AB0D38_18655 [Streptomyces sp. NPDC048279]|uniref:hypothetical protein n=1 Tax=Streptomyces sp. NPDC048279 TaxID=3154714 RepID=UPI003419D572
MALPENGHPLPGRDTEPAERGRRIVRGTTVEITPQGRIFKEVTGTGMRLTLTKRSDPPGRGILVGHG